VLIYGDINVDALARLEAPLVPGADNLHAGCALQLGGVGANVAVSLAKCGGNARLAGCVGRDWLGQFALAVLAEQGVDTLLVRQGEGVTGLVVIPIDPGGRRTIIGARGANEQPPTATVYEMLDDVRAVHQVGYTLLSAHTSALPLHISQTARERGLLVSFDPGPGPCRQARERVLELLPHVDILLIGLDEAEALAGKSGGEALEAIAHCGAGEVLVKRGEGGCQFFEAGRWWAQPPFRVEAVDTTGAGDAFAAGYLCARLRGWAMADCALLANAMGAAACARLGAGEAMPGLADVRELLRTIGAEQADAKLAARLVRLLAT
jgi:sugar/nucleoside kinase (ribokinase family)